MHYFAFSSPEHSTSIPLHSFYIQVYKWWLDQSGSEYSFVSGVTQFYNFPTIAEVGIEIYDDMVAIQFSKAFGLVEE